MAMEVTGETTVAQWRSALAELQKRHPLLSILIAPGRDGMPVFRQVQGAAIPLRLVSEGSIEDWPRAMERELAQPFEDARAPLLRAALLHRADRAVLLLTTHHSISDGISMTFLIRDLMTALAGRFLEPLPVPPSCEQLVEKLSVEPVGAPPNQALPTPLEYAAPDAQLQIAIAALDAETTCALRERSRREGTTVHGALCAAAVLAGRAEYPAWREGEVRLNNPVSYRKALGAGEANGMYIGSGRMRFAPDPSAKFWDLARAAKAQIADAASAAAAKTLALRLNEAVGSLRDLEDSAKLASLTFSCEMNLTNVGAMPYSPDFGSLKLEAVWGPALSMGFHHLPTLGAATANDRLRLLLVEDGPASFLLNSVEKLLRRACA